MGLFAATIPKQLEFRSSLLGWSQFPEKNPAISFPEGKGSAPSVLAAGGGTLQPHTACPPAPGPQGGSHGGDPLLCPVQRLALPVSSVGARGSQQPGHGALLPYSRAGAAADPLGGPVCPRGHGPFSSGGSHRLAESVAAMRRICGFIWKPRAFLG